MDCRGFYSVFCGNSLKKCSFPKSKNVGMELQLIYAAGAGAFFVKKCFKN
jgi:hypothetical protein